MIRRILAVLVACSQHPPGTTSPTPRQPDGTLTKVRDLPCK